MKKLLTSTFCGLFAESRDLAKFLDPANKSRGVDKSAIMIFIYPINRFMR